MRFFLNIQNSCQYLVAKTRRMSHKINGNELIGQQTTPAETRFFRDSLFSTNRWSESTSVNSRFETRHVVREDVRHLQHLVFIRGSAEWPAYSISCLPKILGLFSESTEYEQMKFRLRLLVRHSVCLTALNKGDDVFFLVFNVR